jgi:hypothetical protein
MRSIGNSGGIVEFFIETRIPFASFARCAFGNTSCSNPEWILAAIPPTFGGGNWGKLTPLYRILPDLEGLSQARKAAMIRRALREVGRGSPGWGFSVNLKDGIYVFEGNRNEAIWVDQVGRVWRGKASDVGSGGVRIH